MGIDPSGNEWYHWVIAAGIVIGLFALTCITAGGVGAGLVALTMALNGMASASIGVTILSYATIGASLVFSASAIAAVGMDLMGGTDFMEYGETALIDTVCAGIYGGLGGYLSYKQQIGKSSQAGFMTKNDRTKQRRALMKVDSQKLQGLQISHPYGTYGNNRYYFSYQTPEQHREFHARYGYKTAGGPFNRINPDYVNIWNIIWFL